MAETLPPGQRALDHFPRFGVPAYAHRIPGVPALEKLLGENVLLADRLDGAPLTVEHGAPLRLVVPHRYGDKNVKHVCSVRILSDFRQSFAERQTLAHPRGRVDLEERGVGLPGKVYRVIYRALLPPTLWYYRRASRAKPAASR
jgi:DMSO/TMAO reductase YedYZ molybdopterin-dependent catalytic subunit